ncbi:MAG: hypothetical protein ACD_19C00429G0045 [uncultured bacterium]|nr:MAG: hypothetical protein ACD_19C00429G0045 [uncultured bacterium]
MKIKQLQEVKNKEIKALEAMVSKLRLELSKNKVKIAGGKEKNLKKAWNIKKEIAQILTILSERREMYKQSL